MDNLSRNITETFLWKYNTRIIFILEESNPSDLQHLTLLQKMAERKIYNAVSFGDNNSVWTLFPYKSPQNRFQLLTQTTSFSEWFPDKVRNFNQNPIRAIHCHEFPYTSVVNSSAVRGYNGWLYEIIADKLNASLDLLAVSTSDSDSVIIAFYLEPRFDLTLLLGALTTFLPRGKFSFIYPFVMENINLIHLRRQPGMTSIFGALWVSATWIFFVLAIAIFILFWISVPKEDRRFPAFALDFYRMLLLVSAEYYPTRISSRILIFIFSFGSLIFVSVLQSILTTHLVSPIEPKQIQTVEEMIDAGYKVFFPGVIPWPWPEQEKHIQRIDNNFTTMPTPEFFTKYPKYAILLKQSVFFYFEQLEANIFHMIPQTVYNTPFSQIMHPKAPLYDFLSEFQFRVFEMGLKVYYNNIVLHMFPFLPVRKERSVSSLSLNNHEMAYYVLGCGWLSAFGIFLLEIFWNQIQRNIEQIYIL